MGFNIILSIFFLLLLLPINKIQTRKDFKIVKIFKKSILYSINTNFGYLQSLENKVLGENGFFMNGEMIFIKMTDLGRFIDLKKLEKILPGIYIKELVITRDTPKYIYIPKPLIVELTLSENLDAPYIKNIILQERIYEDGVLSMIARISFENVPLNQLHTVRKIEFSTPDGRFKISKWIDFHFNDIYSKIKDYVEDYMYKITPMEHEKYIIYCITDPLNPYDIIESNKNYFATLLMGESFDKELNESQIKNTLANPFSYLKNDIVIFDLERALIFDEYRDYNDIILITELANYQLLELRSLDHILDVQLDKAEDDIRKMVSESHNVLSKLTAKYSSEFRKIIRMRFDMIFILENLENISKILGDYYLAQIYTHLSKLFELHQWSESIRHRLETIEDIYSIFKSNINEKILLYVETLLAVVFVLEFVFFILGLFIKVN